MEYNEPQDAVVGISISSNDSAEEIQRKLKELDSWFDGQLIKDLGNSRSQDPAVPEEE